MRKKNHFFRQINIVTKEVAKELVSRKFFEHDCVFSTFPNYEMCTPSKKVDFTEFLFQNRRTKFEIQRFHKKMFLRVNRKYSYQVIDFQQLLVLSIKFMIVDFTEKFPKNH